MNSVKSVLSIDQLAETRSVSVKIGALLTLIDELDGDVSCGGQLMLNDRLAQLNHELAQLLPEEAMDDQALMAMLTSPPKGLWINADRKGIYLENIEQWVYEMDFASTEQARSIAQLRLLFYFGTSESMDMFVKIHKKYTEQKQAIRVLVNP